MHRLVGAIVIWLVGIHIVYFGMILNGASRYPRNPVWAWVSRIVAAEIFILKFAAALCVAIVILFVTARILSSIADAASSKRKVPSAQEEKPAVLEIPPVPVQKHPEPLVFQDPWLTSGEVKAVPKSEYVYVPPSPEEVKKNALKQLLRRGS